MRVRWTKPAAAQLREIFSYYNSNAGERTALKIVTKIVATTRLLSHNPLGGGREMLLDDRPEGFRRLISGNYKIVYWILDDEVWIAAVFDARQDPSKLRESILQGIESTELNID